jgi:predicted dehydrogenase
MNILFIGDGEWSSKVSRIILQQDPNFHAEIVGARHFLSVSETSSMYINALHNIEFVWIATNTSLQAKVLEKLKTIKTKVVLEKPIAQTSTELMELKSTIFNSASDVYLSQPWTYSDIWKKFSSLLEQKNSVNKIVIFRGDNRFRSDVTPGLDWIPHDLYLIASVIGQFEIDTSQVDVEIASHTSENISIVIKAGSRICAEINSGFYPTRIAQISGYSDEDLIMTGDFLSGEVKCRENGGETLEVLPTEHSLLNMIRHYQKNSPNLNWDLIFKLYSAILN